ncbi:MAG: hypothetical protein RBT11_08735 [Desulfobacterales bacterium]|jgi:hypothetical protein|nr:hypothetical protein [Desulfobacterales bacterium]
MGINNKLEILDTLTDALGMSEHQTIQEIKDELANDGIDVEAALCRLKIAREKISMAAKRSVLDKAKEKRLNLAERSNDIMDRFKDWTKEQILDRLKQVSKTEAGFAYRDLETMGMEEMKALLEDLELSKASFPDESSNEE